MRIILHAGAHKTASTLIQHYCASNAEVLRENGLFYPAVGREVLFGHHRIATAAFSDAAAETLRSELAKEIGAYEGDILVSSEVFEQLGTEKLERLKHIFNSNDFKVIYYVRRWGGLLYSGWQESIKQGGVDSYHEFLTSHILRPELSAILNPALFIERAIRVFGRDSLTIHSYDVETQGSGIIRGFFSGLLSAELPEPQRTEMNVSLSPPAIEQIRLLNTKLKVKKRREQIRRHYSLVVATAEGRAIQEKLNALMVRHEKEIADEISNSPVSVRYWTDFVGKYGDLIAGDAAQVLEVMTAPEQPRNIVSTDCLLFQFVPASINLLTKLVRNRLQARQAS